MRIDNPSRGQLAAYFQRLDEHTKESGSPQFVKYLDLGTHIVRLINYSAAFTPHIEKQLTFVLKDAAPREPDATLVVRQEQEFDNLGRTLEPRLTAADNPLLARVRKLTTGRETDCTLQVFDQEYSRHHPLINIDAWNRIAASYNPETNTYYYAAENLEPEEFIKQGHIFVQTFNKILKSPSTALVHAAAVGLDGKGILLCARGQRGKSTLAVRAMLDGFEYVADDYLVLGKEESGLYAWPIYSIITLSPMMYGDLYETLDAKFVSNNARKDKYVFNIARYHDRFASSYPIQLCMFTQIVADAEPSVVACTQAGKGRAVTQLVHSTINQMGDKHDIVSIRKLMRFVEHFPFYQINLCRDIEKNLRLLRDFLRTGKCGRQTVHRRMLCSRSA